jgi:rod shape-determining protein MreB
MWRSLDKQFGIDLGTCNTLIYQKGRGIVLREPSLIAVNKETGQIEAYGEQAYAMIGRTPRSIEVIYPLQGGVIANYHMTTSMLQHYIRKVLGGPGWFQRASAVISVPCGVTNVNKRAAQQTMIHKGAKGAATVEEPLAAALGAGLPFYEPVGSMLIDIGGGTTQIAILSLGGIVTSYTLPRGGLAIDETIVEYMKKTYNLAIGFRTAEDIKIRAGALPDKDRQSGTLEVRGNDQVDGLPRTINLDLREITKLLDDFIFELIDAIRVTLEKCPPELAGDVMERGIMMCGGGALLAGLDKRLQEETSIPFFLAEQPMECVAIGAGRLIANENAQVNRWWKEKLGFQ